MKLQNVIVMIVDKKDFQAIAQAAGEVAGEQQVTVLAFGRMGNVDEDITQTKLAQQRIERLAYTCRTSSPGCACNRNWCCRPRPWSRSTR